MIQGGSINNTGSGSSGQPSTPFANENVQQLALTGVDQLALANAGGTDTNDTQFFINTGAADALGYNYTVFGQLVAGQATLTDMATYVPVQNNSVTGEDSQPVNPLTITSASLSVDQPRWRRHHRHHPGEARRNGHNHRHGHRPHRRYDHVAVVQRRGRRLRWTDDRHRPLVISISSPMQARFRRRPMRTSQPNVQLSGQNTYPDTSVKVPLTYSLLSDPATAPSPTSTRRRARFDYTPDPGYIRPRHDQLCGDGERAHFDGRRRDQQPGHGDVNVAPTPPLVSVQNVTLATNKKAHGDANRRHVQRSSQRRPGR